MPGTGWRRNLVRVVAPTQGCVEVDGVTGRRYRARGGFYDMSPADGRALVAYGGFEPSLAGTTGSRVGYRCAGCGFGSYFRTCSRCGGVCVKESTDDDGSS